VPGPIKVLGIDPGSAACGYALLEVEGAKARLLRAGVLRTPRGADFAAKLAALASAVERLVADCRPEEAAVESVFHALHAQSALRLAHARGVIVAILAREGVGVSEYMPAQIKKAVSGYGQADKDSVRALVARLLGVGAAELPQDASDAAAVALCHAHAAPVRRAVVRALASEGRAAGRGRAASPPPPPASSRGRAR
jgi:crossover junction endodeoxyribonuclease RuvC